MKAYVVATHLNRQGGSSNNGSQYTFLWKNKDNTPLITPLTLLIWSTVELSVL